MKFLFLFIFLINSCFFLWQYRQGAPEIYLPHRPEHNSSVQHKDNNIILVSEMPARQAERVVIADSEPTNAVTEALEELTFVGSRQPLSSLDSKQAEPVEEHQSVAEGDFVEPLYPEVEEREQSVHQSTEFVGPLPNPAGSSLSDNDTHKVEQVHDTTDPEVVPQHNSDVEAIKPLAESEQSDTEQVLVNAKAPEAIKRPTPVRVCYLLQNSADRRAMVSQSGDYSLTFIEREYSYIRSYLVLTSAANSLREAKAKEQAMRQQGLNDVWLFRRGEFKGRISVGLFRIKDKASRAQRIYARRTTEALTVVPNYKTKILTEVVTDIQADNIADFEEQFSSYLDKSSECENAN